MTEKINESLTPLVRPIAGLREDPKNTRSHGKRSIEGLRRSLQEYGQQKAIVVREDGTVVAGNGTLRAALALGWEKIAVAVFDGSAKAARSFAIMDNRVADLSGFDSDMLGEELRALKAEEVDLGSLGFDDAEFAAIVDAEEAIVEDSAGTSRTRTTVRATLEIPSRVWLVDGAEIRRRVETALADTGATASWPS